MSHLFQPPVKSFSAPVRRSSKSVTLLSSIAAWNDVDRALLDRPAPAAMDTLKALHDSSLGYAVNEEINSKISIWKGDITTLAVDAIVNAANSHLFAGGGVCGAIFAKAGQRELQAECYKLGGCEEGQTKATSAYKMLHVKKIFHTVAPDIRSHSSRASVVDMLALSNCYSSVLDLAKQNQLRTVAIPCLGTGIFGWPNEKGAEIALRTTREWLESSADNLQAMDRIVFCVFLPVDESVFYRLTPFFFPLKENKENEKKNDSEGEESDSDEKKEKYAKHEHTHATYVNGDSASSMTSSSSDSGGSIQTDRKE